ncbi:MAG: hypothetical protein LM567_02900 [Desulfurococcaceae archaeon]|jgi:hypothetical protein|nr:hypothetical protein [Desulfurococcaceae archaeon]
MSKCKFREDLDKAIELYNRLHGVEAQAKIIDVNGEKVIIEFTGTFCHTCGVRDWLEDLAYLLVSMGYNAKLVEYIEPKGEEFQYKRIGVFQIKHGSEESGDRENQDR